MCTFNVNLMIINVKLKYTKQFNLGTTNFGFMYQFIQSIYKKSGKLCKKYIPNIFKTWYTIDYRNNQATQANAFEAFSNAGWFQRSFHAYAGR